MTAAPQDRVCPACDATAPGGREECPACGAPLDVLAALDSVGPRRHFLVTAAGESIPLPAGRPFVVGRAKDADLVARSTDVSRQHAQVLLATGHAEPVLRDLGSKHGTFVQGERLEPRVDRRLHHGDQVRLASNTELFYLEVPEGQLRREIALRGLGELTSEFAVADMKRRQTTRSMRRMARRGAEGRTKPRQLPGKGDLAATAGTQVLALLKEHEFTGELSFFDGAQRGALQVLAGVPRGGKVGRLEGDDAVAAFREARQGTFRLRRQLPHEGSLHELPADALLIELFEAKATGVVTLLQEDAPDTVTGRLVLIEGIVRSAGFGKQVSAPALRTIGELHHGRFRFEAKTREELDGRLKTPRGRRETIEQPEPPQS